MSESTTPSKSSTILHWVALVLLFLMMAEPTFGNINALFSGAFEMGDTRIEVGFTDMILHIVAMVVGWVGLWWFYKRQKRGAYLSIVAHLLGFTAAFTQTPEMLEVMPPAFIGVFFVILFVATLGPIFAFKGQYS